ncbi:hypothetical protein FZC83_02395 [Rossellomorea marisflavi]|uniref:Uncharacterized protein n=1 Tax=Rossellomorea marisflavi TaxID=189381 RepID=A0A5D4S2V8_9BACI|nr:hypothetical protein [Rossellomorea marisflavi]TYS56444.1 hypothetical protein FZC83_02395 [Rossellomorea marisflavi]
MSKQLSIAVLEEEIKHYDEVFEVDFVGRNGESYVVKIHPYFKPEKVSATLREAGDFFNKAKEEKLVVPEFEQEDLIMFFIVKQFTNLKFTRSKKAKKVYSEFKIAINTPLFAEIVKAFPDESLEAVYKRMYEIQEKTQEFQEKYVKQAEEVFAEMKTKNKEIFAPKSE